MDLTQPPRVIAHWRRLSVRPSGQNAVAGACPSADRPYEPAEQRALDVLLGGYGGSPSRWSELVFSNDALVAVSLALDAVLGRVSRFRE